MRTGPQGLPCRPTQELFGVALALLFTHIRIACLRRDVVVEMADGSFGGHSEDIIRALKKLETMREDMGSVNPVIAPGQFLLYFERAVYRVCGTVKLDEEPVAHRSDQPTLVLRDGRMQAFGPKETVLGQVLQRVAPPSPIKIVSEGGVAKS